MHSELESFKSGRSHTLPIISSLTLNDFCELVELLKPDPAVKFLVIPEILGEQEFSEKEWIRYQEACETLFNLIGTNKNLQGLRIDGKILNHDLLENLQNPNIERLTIREGIKSEVIKDFANYIKNSKTLKKLALGKQEELKDNEIQIIIESLAHNRSIKNLEIWKIKTGAGFNRTITHTLKVNHTLKIVEFGDCNFVNGGASAIAQGMRDNQTVTYLIMSHCIIGSNDGRVIGDMLKANDTLKYLDLDSCDLGDAGGSAIGDGLKYNSGLLHLNLNNTGLRDRGMAAIAQGAENHNTLISLDLESESFEYRDSESHPNELGRYAATALRKLMEKNTVLRVLDINFSYPQQGLSYPQSSYSYTSDSYSHIVKWLSSGQSNRPFQTASHGTSSPLSEIAAGLKNNHTLAAFIIEDAHMPKKIYISSADVKILSEAIITSGNKNLVSYGCYGWYRQLDTTQLEKATNPETISNINKIYEYCGQNCNVVEALLAKIKEHPEELTLDDVQECKERMNALLDLAPSELEAEIPALLQRRAEEIRRQTALQRRRETNDRVRHDLSHYAQENGLTFEQMCREIALHRRTDDAYT